MKDFIANNKLHLFLPWPLQGLELNKIAGIPAHKLQNQWTPKRQMIFFLSFSQGLISWIYSQIFSIFRTGAPHRDLLEYAILKKKLYVDLEI